MCELKEKVVFLQGLAQGMEINEDSKEGKLITAMLDVLADMADAVAEISEDLDEVYDYVDELDEDLAEVEEEVFGEEECDCGCDCDCDCDCEEDGDCECDEDDYVEVTCPNCHEVVCFSSDILEADEPIEVVCPVCDAAVFSNDAEYIDLEAEEEGKCTCGCEDKE